MLRESSRLIMVSRGVRPWRLSRLTAKGQKRPINRPPPSAAREGLLRLRPLSFRL
jgi:hypothetical protein